MSLIQSNNEASAGISPDKVWSSDKVWSQEIDRILVRGLGYALQELQKNAKLK